MHGLLALLSLIKTRRSRVISCYSLDIGCLIFWYMSCWNNDEMKKTGDRTGDVVEMKDMATGRSFWMSSPRLCQLRTIRCWLC